jgi:probable rRNA maturation factor
VFSDQAGVDVAIVRWLRRQLARVAKLAGVRRGALSVAIVDDTQMARLHRRYLNVPGTTDVLSFDLRDDQAGAEVQGELVLCFDEAVRQSRRRGHKARLELLLYAVHGLLHLLGWDDRDPRAAAAMHRREDELLTAAGVGRVFDSGKSRGRA